LSRASSASLHWEAYSEFFEGVCTQQCNRQFRRPTPPTLALANDFCASIRCPMILTAVNFHSSLQYLVLAMSRRRGSWPFSVRIEVRLQNSANGLPRISLAGRCEYGQEEGPRPLEPGPELQPIRVPDRWGLPLCGLRLPYRSLAASPRSS
jgi:hypothetical protein